MSRLIYLFSILSVLFLSSCSGKEDSQVELKKTAVFSVKLNGNSMSRSSEMAWVPVDDLTFTLTFSSEVDIEKFDKASIFCSGGSLDVSYGDDKKTLDLKLNAELDYFTRYTFTIVAGNHLGVEIIDSITFSFATMYDPSDKFQRISDEELLTLIQEKTFSYFWDYAHPVSGLARERFNSDETVTSGGSGFGVMTIPVGIERGFITREEGAERLSIIVDFLLDAERFHGAFPHWLNGTTGEAIAFSTYDDGADLVETSLLMQGLLTVQQYFDRNTSVENSIREGIQTLWEEVEWDWFLNGQNVLYWHWSSEHDWKMNMQIKGWNEALITYVLAASSPTHPISKEVYEQGWTSNGSFVNGRKYYDVNLPLGPDKGGPLFFAHYSFLGLDPRNLSDNYTSYWEQNISHSKINYSYCVENPKKHIGYSENCWGLTASDIPSGYTASSPTNDGGTIAPTAAISSMPYTPEESMTALKYFYYVLGDKLVGKYGFKDAFNLSQRWFASSYIAIDQGPILIMIENYRTGLLWDCFMKNADVRNGLDKLGFGYTMK